MAEPQAEDLKTVVLNDEHVRLGGRMVPFSGYSLPVQYPTGIIAEHKWTREHAGLFDVSHMGPSWVTYTGDAGVIAASTFREEGGYAHGNYSELAALIEQLVCGDIANLKPNQLRYTLLLNDEGGTIDDLMVGRANVGEAYVIVNAGTKEDDFALIQGALGGVARLTRLDDHALLALQGPEAVEVLRGIIPGVDRLGFMTFETFRWDDLVTVSRSGYTGEDGFEILVPPQLASKFWNALLADPRVKPIGLGARDSLRLEAGLPLYGHDLDETVSPTEAGLNFAISKRRREAADFPGAARILREFAGDLSRIRVGLFVEGAPAREGAEILDASGAAIGRVTSGGFAPSLNRAIALGFVPPASSAPGTKLQVSVRGRLQPAEVTLLPFVPHRYVRKATP
ncbi:MAG: glycine cleavage system aminomethyltransferase GcvT [Devosia sp.]|nr:glycine cleavage system aminomethyltransferase GcvT [Devosia sp.]